MLKRILLLLLLIVPLASAIEQNYNIIIEDNGNSLIIIEFQGKGLINIPIQEDVDEVKVKGALYKLNNNSIDVSIGSSKKAILLYQTSFLTKKEHDVWTFSFDVLNNSNISISMPKNTIIKHTSPNPFIESQNFTRLIFENSNSIELLYEFKEDLISDDIEELNTPKKRTLFPVLLVVGISIIAIVTFLVFSKKKSNKDNIIKTLSRNEKLVVKTILENKGEIKRNLLERKTQLAKSSLSNTLNILERKKIIEIDKTSVTHFVKFTRWFNEL